MLDNQTGRVGLGLRKLKQPCSLVVEICQLGAVSQKPMQKAIRLLVHPAIHNQMQPKKEYPSPRGVKEELLWMCLCLPVMHSDVKWPVSCHIGASDASLGGGGRAAC